MVAVSITSDVPVTLVGGGALGEGDVKLAVSHAPTLVAADGGAGPALRSGHEIQAVIGDFDSIDPADRDRIPPDRLFPIQEQDSTDFDKALRHISAPLVLAVGFLGARIDHELAALNTLVTCPEPRCILIGTTDVIFHLPRRVALGMAEGDRVSLFPLAEVTGRSTGLEWPIDGLVFSPWARIGTSNRATGPVEIETDGPGLLAVLPRRALTRAIDALTPRP